MCGIAGIYNYKTKVYDKSPVLDLTAKREERKQELVRPTLRPELKQELLTQKELPFKIEAEKGVLIVQIAKNSPAFQAGLKPGDIILKVGEAKVETATDVQEQVELSRIGQTLQLEIDRQQKTEIIAIRPGAFPVQ
jgi:S1-C subfamily serine protease